MIVSHTVILFMLLSFKHLTRASTTFYWGYSIIDPKHIHADILTFQKLSFNNSTNLFNIFLLGLWHILEIAQHAMLRFLLSLSLRHLAI